MQPHQQRVIDEKKQLEEKLANLSSFISDSPVFTGLPTEERDRLIRQKSIMVEYNDILQERINAF